MKILICLVFLFSTLGMAGCRSEINSGSDIQAQSPTPSKIPQIGVGFVTVTPTINSQIYVPEPATPVEASPLPTRSSFIYLVKPGDTLFDIAATHNTTTQEISGLNPDLDPSLLLVGQEILLPVPVVTPESTPVATNMSVAVELSGLNSVETTTGGVWLFGEVNNGTGQSVENIIVNLRLFDDVGQLLKEEQVWVAANILGPEKGAPFGILINPAPEGNVNFQAEIISADAVVDVGNRYTDFEVSDSEVTIENSRVSVSGQIHNMGAMVANSISIVVTIYDESAKITGYTVIELDEPMNPDERRSFMLDALPPGHDSVAISLIVEGLAAIVED